MMGISTPTEWASPTAALVVSDAFGDHAVHAADDLVELASAPEFHAHAAVAGEPAGAGQHQVSQAGESGHGFGASSAGDGQAGHLGESAGDQSGHRVVTVADAVHHSGGDGNHVLDRASQFQSDHVIVAVEAEVGVAEGFLHLRGERGIGGGHAEGGGIALGDLARKGGSADARTGAAESCLRRG